MYNHYYSNITPKKAAIESVLRVASEVKSKAEGTPYYCTVKPVDVESIINNCQQALPLLRNFSQLLIVGMGGAVNNPKLVLSALNAKNVYYLNTTDPDYFANLVASIELKSTAVLMISNSGQTIENIAAYSALMALDQSITKRSVFLVGKGDNSLTEIAARYNILQIPYDTKIGGRFSGFSEVVALPLLARGFDAHSFLAQASNIAKLFASADETLVASLAVSVESFKDNSVLLSYCNNLKDYGEWYSQVFGESLGKDGKGIYPVQGIGPQDQHSMLQLYLDGPDCAFYNIVKVKSKSDFKGIDFSDTHVLSAAKLSVVHEALCDSTVGALEFRNRPLRVTTIAAMNEAAIAELMMFTSLEVVVLAGHMNVNPFDQPGVELIKIRTRKILEDAKKASA